MRKIQTRMLRQDLPGATKRWYVDDGSGDLATWTDGGGGLLQFQWGFRVEGWSYVLEWKRGAGSRIFQVSDEENVGAATGGPKASPTMQPLATAEAAALHEVGRAVLLQRIASLPDPLALAIRLALEDLAPEARP